MKTPAATAAGKRRASARVTRPRPAAPRPTRRTAPKPRRSRSRIRPRISIRRSWRRGLLLGAILCGGLAIAYFAWFRDSSFVAVRDVKVEGASTADGDAVTAAITDAAEGMTTLHFDTSRLASAVSGFPSVASVSADTSFPHGVTVHVTERRPALVVGDGDHRIPVAADGSLLPGLDVDGSTLPVIHMESVPTAPKLSGEPLEEARALAAAPDPLVPLIEDVGTSDDHGIVVTLRQGIDLRFGTASGAGAKWAAAAAILADPDVTSVGYVDVRVPQRPAIGG